MSAEDQSFVDLMELCDSHFAKRPRTDTEECSSELRYTRKGPRKHSRSLDSDLDEGGNLATILDKLTLRQEDQLNQLHLDRTFIFFDQAGKGSILPQMLQVSNDWHVKRE